MATVVRNVCRVFLYIATCLITMPSNYISVFAATLDMPGFDVPVINVTAVAGSTAILPCKVNNLGEHKVVWMDFRNKVLTMAENRVINDQRVSLERPFTQDWNLHLRKVQMNDTGPYKCQINTSPVKSKKINLIVQEPPTIYEDSGDQTANEGNTVSLFCKATGVPMPLITWYRRYMHEPHQAKEVIGEHGEVLNIYNISRYCEDTYECVADNGIDPPASRKMKVSVQFKPEVRVLNPRLSQWKGRETLLDCQITAYPHGQIVWKKDNREIVTTHKYGINIYDDDRFQKTLSLRIGNLDDNDFGKYVCHASNVLGSDEEATILGEEIERTPPPPPTTTTTRQPWYGHTDYINIHSHVNDNKPGIWNHPTYQPAGAAYGRSNGSGSSALFSTNHRSYTLVLIISALLLLVR